MLQRVERLLARPSAPLWLGLFAVVLCLPSLRYGLQADDHLFPVSVERGEPAWSLFRLDAESVAVARDQGALVWWSNPELDFNFFRPLASLTHTLDFTLWPDAPWLMRLFNALLYGGSVALAAMLYRHLAPSAAIASLAALLFALDDSHALSVGWIASRNTLLAILFSLASLLLHLRARERGSSRLQLACAACVGLALASAEAGVWSLALLLSYALAMEPGSLLTRLRSVTAPLAIGLVWAIAYVTLDFGFRGTSVFRDPSAPVDTLLQGVLDLPVWFATLTGMSGFPWMLLYPTEIVRLWALPIGLFLLWLLFPELRSSRECRFFALASLFCLIPVMFTLPNSRVLLGSSFGALGWIACHIAAGRAADTARGRWGARLMLALHLWIAGLTFGPALGTTQSAAYGTSQIMNAVQPGRDVVLLQSPVELLSNHVLLALGTRARAAESPRSLHQLYTGTSELWVERIDAQTLEVEAILGWGRIPIERMLCAADRMPRAGSEVRLRTFTARVLESNADGMPQRVRFVFPTPLESPERQWLAWEGNRVVPWTPPREGERMRIAPLSRFEALQP
jgi:hypothetical protein